MNDFSYALRLMKNNIRMRRKGWKTKVCAYVKDDDIGVISAIIDNDKLSTEDLLSNDWEIAYPERILRKSSYDLTKDEIDDLCLGAIQGMLEASEIIGTSGLSTGYWNLYNALGDALRDQHLCAKVKHTLFSPNSSLHASRTMNSFIVMKLLLTLSSITSMLEISVDERDITSSINEIVAKLKKLIEPQL